MEGNLTAGTYHPEKIFNKYFILTWITAFALQMGQNIFNNSISVFAVSLGYSNTFAGALALPYMVLAIAGRFLSGYFSDTVSRRLCMVAGCLSFCIGSFFYHVPALLFPLTLMVFRGLHGFGYATASSGYSAAVIDVTPREKMALGLGINWTAQGTAQLLGGIVTVVLVFGTDYNPLFICSTVFCAVSVICSALCSYEKGSGLKPENSGKKDFRFSDFIEKSALPHAWMTLVYYFGISIGTFYTVSLAQSRGIEGGGYFFTACALGMIITNLTLVKIAERFGRFRALLPVFVIAAACNLSLALCGSLGVLLLAGVMYGVAVGAMPVIQSAAIESLPANRRGAGTSTVFLAMDISMGVGPVFWGAFIDNIGFAQSYYISIAIIVAGAFMSAFVFAKKKR